jgi:phosphopantothenoylcysteine synthetase/decarboxylase
MRVLVTAGNTLIPIDRVRCITNVFTGRTGTLIALHAYERGHAVTLLTSHPELIAPNAVDSGLSKLARKELERSVRWAWQTFKTFDDLEAGMQQNVCPGDVDAVIHCAAVSDYRSVGIYAPAPETQFREQEGRWASKGHPSLVEKSAAKIKSDEPELWLRLIRTPKLVDRIRADWRFTGILVKFKLEVGVSEEHLLEIAEQSRRHSGADLMVANTLETASTLAYLGPIGGSYQRIEREQLPKRLLEAVESLHKERKNG